MAGSTLSKNSLRLRLTHQFALDHAGALGVLQNLGLVSDNCIEFDEIAPDDAQCVLENWKNIKASIAKESAAQ